MKTKLKKWGNSIGIRIPNVMLKTLDLKNEDMVSLEQVDDRIIITKCIKNQISLKELFDKYEGDTLSKDFNWDEARGKEVW